MEPNATELNVVREVLDAFATEQHQLLPLLREVQRRVGYVPRAALPIIADRFNLSRAEVHGVATFYHDLRDAPAGRHHVQLCGAEACQAVGCRTLAAHAERSLGVALGGTTADGRITLELVYCFGNCACGPTIRIGAEVYGRVTRDRFDEIVATLDRTEAAT